MSNLLILSRHSWGSSRGCFGGRDLPGFFGPVVTGKMASSRRQLYQCRQTWPPRSSKNRPKNAASSSCASSGSTFETYWSGRTTTIAPFARWSHVSIYVGTLEAGDDPRLHRRSRHQRRRSRCRCRNSRIAARIVRPLGLNEADRLRLADWLVSRIGAPTTSHMLGRFAGSSSTWPRHRLAAAMQQGRF